MERRYWMVVLLPSLTLVMLFLISTATPHWLWRPLQSHGDKGAQSLTTSKALLALLKHQEAELHAELNSTTEPAIRHAEFVKLQLKLNVQLQNMVTPPESTTVCQKSARPEEMRGGGIPWQPNLGKYLVMICDSGQVTNHLICLHKHMYFGALLNRTLVLPHESLDYQYEHLLDMTHLKRCLGDTSIVTLEEFQRVKHMDLRIDRLICYMHNCYFDKEHQTKWEALGFTFGERHDAWSSSLSSTSARFSSNSDDIIAKFKVEDPVIAIGDMYYAEVQDSGGFAVAHMCRRRGMVQPHRDIVVTAQRFVQTYLGSRFLSLHFRRHGFLVFCNKQRAPSCFYPIPQAARCIERKVRESRAEVIYLSSDAPTSEIVALKQQLGSVAMAMQVVTRSAVHEAAAKWDSLLWRKGLESDPAVMAMVDKCICALGVAFVGTRGSTFSNDIQRMRHDWGTSASCDGPLCDWEAPTFVAEFP